MLEKSVNYIAKKATFIALRKFNATDMKLFTKLFRIIRKKKEE